MTGMGEHEKETDLRNKSPDIYKRRTERVQVVWPWYKRGRCPNVVVFCCGKMGLADENERFSNSTVTLKMVFADLSRMECRESVRRCTSGTIVCRH